MSGPSRRAFLASIAGGWLISAFTPSRGAVPGTMRGASHRIGHRLRDSTETQPGSAAPERVDIVIVGAGVSGLSAAWRLRALGLSCQVLELEPFVGGTSTWGSDGVTEHPWGAHYLAAPNVEARATLRLLQDMGVVTGHDLAGRPTFDPTVLCHAPEERLFYQGTWHPSLAPTDALDSEAIEELERFTETTHRYTEMNGRDGRPAFTIPLESSSRDPELLALDSITMADWLNREGYRTPFVRWYVEYATLDDFGGNADTVSAWAGLHYFCSRKLKSDELEGSHFLVWPEGNGHLVKALRDRGEPEITNNALVKHVAPSGDATHPVDVHWAPVGPNADAPARRFRARGVVMAVPSFIGSRLMRGSGAAWSQPRTSSPWLVANLHVDWPIDPDLPWDSVIYDSKGLGYVDAGHQIAGPGKKRVLTYYRAFGQADAAASRKALLDMTWSSLADGVLADLAPAHPHLNEQLDRLDLMVWGHAMPRPIPGFLGPKPFDATVRIADRVVWAHVDQSGIALFEEAMSRGVIAAETLAAELTIPIPETWR